MSKKIKTGLLFGAINAILSSILDFIVAERTISVKKTILKGLFIGLVTGFFFALSKKEK